MGMREMWRIRVWSEEWDGNAGNQCGNAGNLGGKLKNVENQGGDAGNQDGNGNGNGNSNGNDKFKEWREVKIMENKHFCKTFISDISSGVFLVNFGHIKHNVFLFLLLFLSR